MFKKKIIIITCVILLIITMIPVASALNAKLTPDIADIGYHNNSHITIITDQVIINDDKIYDNCVIIMLNDTPMYIIHSTKIFWIDDYKKFIFHEKTESFPQYWIISKQDGLTLVANIKD